MKLKIAQAIGLNTDQKAAQVSSSTRDETTFLAVLDFTSDDAFTKGRQILSELEDFYFEAEGGLAEKLNATFSEAQNKLTEGKDFSLCLSVISGKVLYLIGKGQVEVYLKRKDKLSALLSIGTPSQLISGFIEGGDRLLFATKNLTDFLGDDLTKSLSLPIEIFEEEVGGKIGASETEDQGLAGLAVEIQEEEQEISTLKTERAESSGFAGDKRKISFAPLFGALAKLKELITTYFPKSGRGRLVLAILLFLAIGIGIFFQYKSSRDQKINAEVAKYLQEARDDFDAAKGLSSLNPGDAKSRLDSAGDKLNKALALRSNNDGAKNLKKQIEDELPAILQESSVSNFPVFLDLDLVKKNFSATQMSLSDGSLLLLDQGEKTLISIDIAKKSNQILGGSNNLGEASLSSINGKMVFVYSKDKGILRIDTTNSKVTTVAKTDPDLGKIGDIYGFASNIYILDAQKSQIWKYVPGSEGYSSKRAYLSSGTKADFSNAVRMQIESSVYVLKAGGEILRFTKGDKDTFAYSGLPSNVKDPKSIFTSSETDNLYVLDSGNSRMLILNKTGGFQGQVIGNKFSSATDLVVDEIGKKVYLLEGGKIYTADLK